MIACFDDAIDEEVITEIAKQQPLYAVFKDQSFASDSVAINNEQLFKTHSPATTIKVIWLWKIYQITSLFFQI